MDQLPIRITKKGTEADRGFNVLRENCTAAKLVAELFSTSIGPAGMSKILLEDNGGFKVTRDGGIISKEVELVHPVGKILVDAGQAARNEVGDGFISTVLLAGLLIEKGWRLVNDGLHSSLIAAGYQLAFKEALKTVEDESTQLIFTDHGNLVRIAERSLATKMPRSWAGHLAPIVVKALLRTAVIVDGRVKVRRELVKVDGRSGGSVEDSCLVEGVVIHKKGVDRLMPKRITGATIAFIQSMIGIRRPDMFTKVVISNPAQVREFYEWRWSILDDFLKPMFNYGVNVLICGGDIAEELRKPLANHGVLAVRNVAPEDIKILREATGGELVLTPRELYEAALGYCDKVEQRVLAAHDQWLFFEGCKNIGLGSILLRGPGDFIVDEVKRAVANTLRMLESLIADGRLVEGQGVIEYQMAREVRRFAYNLPSKIQLAVLAFAEALEELPLYASTNSGKDPLAERAAMRSRITSENHLEIRGDESSYGNILEPTVVKIQILKSAVEAATSILRVDHMVKQPPKPREKKDPIPAPVRALRRGRL